MPRSDHLRAVSKTSRNEISALGEIENRAAWLEQRLGRPSSRLPRGVILEELGGIREAVERELAERSRETEALETLSVTLGRELDRLERNLGPAEQAPQPNLRLVEPDKRGEG